MRIARSTRIPHLPTLWRTLVRGTVSTFPCALSLSRTFDQGGGSNEVAILGIFAPAPCRRCFTGSSGRVHFCCGPRGRHDFPKPCAGAKSQGTATSFAVLGGSTVTNTGPSVINGNVGVSPGSAIIGFPGNPGPAGSAPRGRCGRRPGPGRCHDRLQCAGGQAFQRKPERPGPGRPGAYAAAFIPSIQTRN